MAVPIYTFNYFDPNTSSVLGSIVATHVEAISVGRSIVADVKGIFGGKASEMDKKIKDTLNGAKDEFIRKTKEQFPTATSVIGYKIQITEIGNGNFIAALMIGTAVGPKQKGGNKNKTYRRRNVIANDNNK
jgi:uncharacterized protein YbjQ (UPF0145 family)